MRDALLQALLSASDAGDAGPNCQLRMGVVTQASPLLVQVGAATVGQPCSRVSTYAPAVNDYVAVLVRGADRIAVGSVGGEPLGVVSGGFAEATASSWSNASTSTPSDITASAGTAPALTLTLSTSRKYRVTFVADVRSTASGDRVYFFFVENGTTRRVARLALPTSGQDFQCVLSYVFTPASASAVIYKIQGRPGNSSTGTVSVSVNSTDQKMQFTIEDIGPA